MPIGPTKAIIALRHELEEKSDGDMLSDLVG